MNGQTSDSSLFQLPVNQCVSLSTDPDSPPFTSRWKNTKISQQTPQSMGTEWTAGTTLAKYSERLTHWLRGRAHTIGSDTFLSSSLFRLTEAKDLINHSIADITESRIETERSRGSQELNQSSQQAADFRLRALEFKYCYTGRFSLHLLYVSEYGFGIKAPSQDTFALSSNGASRSQQGLSF